MTTISSDPGNPIDVLFRDLIGRTPTLADHDLDLSDAGIDSLSAMELLVAAEDVAGREIALDALDALHTVGDLLALLDELGQRVSP